MLRANCTDQGNFAVSQHLSQGSKWTETGGRKYRIQKYRNTEFRNTEYKNTEIQQNIGQCIKGQGLPLNP